MTIPTSSIDVAILCGGRGTRLQTVVNDRPKPMAEINGKPFLDFLIKRIASYGFRRFILCTGYKSAHIADYYNKLHDQLTYIISEETSPLGTAGAISNAKHKFKSNPVLVLNGDSYCPTNLSQLIDFHKCKQAATTIVLTEIENPQDFGVITLNQQEQISGFNEKPQSSEPGIINAGIYVLSSNAIASIPTGKSASLETEVFPALIAKGEVYGYTSHEKLIDIGTPEQLEKAKQTMH